MLNSKISNSALAKEDHGGTFAKNTTWFELFYYSDLRNIGHHCNRSKVTKCRSISINNLESMSLTTL